VTEQALAASAVSLVDAASADAIQQGVETTTQYGVADPKTLRVQGASFRRSGAQETDTAQDAGTGVDTLTPPVVAAPSDPAKAEREADRPIDEIVDGSLPRLNPPATGPSADRDDRRNGTALSAPEVIEPLEAGTPLQLTEVLDATLGAFPPLLEAASVVEAARGNELSQWGSFDTNLVGSSLNQFLGYYENYRQGLTVEQPLWWGADVLAGYRIGDGNFEPWYGNRETNEGGEFKLAMKAPLLQGLAVDKRRTNVRTAAFDREATDFAFQALRLVVQRDTSTAYWEWVAAGRMLLVQQRLLELALERVEQLNQRILQGDLPRIESVNNQQLIAARRAKVIEAERKIQQTAIKLSVFYRDAAGLPLVPPTPRLPRDFPTIDPPDSAELLAEIPGAQARRPEIQQYRAKADSLQAKLALAQNETLPKLDALVDGGQDVGGLTSSKGDKQELVLMAGVAGEVPIQRRMAQGKIREALGLLQANDANRQFAADKIGAEIRDHVSRLITAYGRIQQAELNVELAAETLRLGRLAFEVGDADVLILNLREQQLADAALDLIAAQAAYFEALAAYQTALGFDVDEPAR
jgi:outer membrane protein TolC